MRAKTRNPCHITNLELLGLKHAEITPKIIGASFEVHKFLGNGFQKVIYQRALQYEMHQAGLTFQRQIGQSIYYKDLPEPIGDRTTHLLQRLTRTHW